MNIIAMLLCACGVAGCVAAAWFLIHSWISYGCPTHYDPDEWQEAKRRVDYMDFCQEVEEKYREKADELLQQLGQNGKPFDPEAHKNYQTIRHYYIAKMDYYGGGRA